MHLPFKRGIDDRTQKVTCKMIQDKDNQLQLIKEDNLAGRLTYSKAGDTMIIIESIVVDPAHRGKGFGSQLFYAAVEKARQENVKIVPVCPFAKTLFAQDVSVQDVLKKD